MQKTIEAHHCIFKTGVNNQVKEILNWKNFLKEQPKDKSLLYWWRMPAKEYGGVILSVEWVDGVSDRMLYSDILFPYFAHWDGYRIDINKELEWAVYEEEEKPKPVWKGLSLLNCPFCNTPPEFSAYLESQCGGLIINNEPTRSNSFVIKCRSCYMATTDRLKDLKLLIDKWNTRY